VTALDRLLEIADARPCDAGAPLLHRLVDGELSRGQARDAKAHVRGCEPCRTHLHLLELEEQTIRELAAPTARRFVALWSDRLRLKMAEAVAEEAGEALLRAENERAARRLAELQRWLAPDERRPRTGHSPGKSGSARTTSACSIVRPPTLRRIV